MDSYIVGNIIGRLLMSYCLVWLVLLVINRMNWRLAFQKSKKWYGVLPVVVLFLLGVSVRGV